MKIETAELHPPEWHKGKASSRSPGFGVTAIVALLLLALLAYGAWAQTPATGMTASETDRMAPLAEGYQPQGANPPAARPHPRGMPRRERYPGTNDGRKETA